MTFEPSRAAWRALPAARRRLIARGAWHNETAIEAGDARAAVLLAVAADGPTAARPVSATVDDGGITFPAYRARVPWSSIHDAWAVGATSLTVLITGPYQPTGRLPTSWRRQIDKRLRGEVRIAARRPEALLAVTERNRPGRTRPNTDPAQPAPNSR